MKQEYILELIKAVSESNLQTFKYEENDTKLVLSKKQRKEIIRNTEVSSTVSNPGIEASSPVVVEEVSVSAGNVITSPLVGTFYVAAAEGAEPFVKVGDAVQKGQTLAIVEAMKLMNEIESEYQGVIAEVLVENGEMVEYGQPLFRIN